MAKSSKLVGRSIGEWVDYIQTIHHREIDLTLERVNEVYQRLYPEGVDFKIISVAGTNGKGSTAELLSAIYHAAGYKTAKYTSPHLQFFNERFMINRSMVDDHALLAAFSAVEQARQTTALTYFEFGTLLAIELFASAKVDVAIMEVGLGGRLDAVNILDSDVAVVTSISIDHTDWLGSTIEEIAHEKIAIARPERPCVIGLSELPKTMSDYCRQYEVDVYQIGNDFSHAHDANNNTWSWQSKQQSHNELPLPFGQKNIQLNNASLAMMVVQLLQQSLPVDDQVFRQGIANAKLAARCQILSKSPHIVIDVAHNPASVANLAEFVAGLSIQGKIYAVCGMLKDKQIAQSLAHLAEFVDEWHLSTIDHERGSSAHSLESILIKDVLKQSEHLASFCYDNVDSAYNAARSKLTNDDALIVFGSFFIVGDIINKT